MDQKDFDRIIKKYLLGEATPEEEQLIDQWYSRIEDSTDDLGIVEKFQLKARMQRKLNEHKSRSYSRSEPTFSRFKPSFSLSFKISLAAAVISAFIVVYYVFLINPPSHRNLDVPIANSDFIGETIQNTGTSIKVISLADGSRVSLNAGSSIQIADSFNKTNREIFLRKGEAFFEVTRDAARPFLVYTDEVVTKVLGTSFRVDARKPDIVVAVKTGRVSVFSKNGSGSTGPADKYAEVILTPNQQVIYDSNQGKMSCSLVEEPSVVVPAEDLKDMHFESAKVSAILEAVSKAYGISIVYDSDLLSSCLLTTFVSENEDLYKRLDIICEAIGATYEVDGLDIRISSNGCRSKN